jgi:hypothetical protein
MPRTNKVKAETECKTRVEVNTVDTVAPAKKPRKPRAAKKKPAGGGAKKKSSAYAQYVKDNYDKVRDLPCCDRFKKLGEMWKKQKGGNPAPDG